MCTVFFDTEGIVSIGLPPERRDNQLHQIHIIAEEGYESRQQETSDEAWTPVHAPPGQRPAPRVS